MASSVRGRSPERDTTVDAACALIDEFDPAPNATLSPPQRTDPAVVLRALMLAEQAIQRRADDGSLPAADATRRLRRAVTLARLLDRRGDRQPGQQTMDGEMHTATTELCHRFGFDRTMVFDVRPTALHVSATCFAQKSDWRDEIHRRMIESPPPLDLPGHEARVVREGCTLVVEGAQDDPYTWKPLIRPAAITSYVSAPIRLGGATVATLHADRWFQRSEVSVEDRDLVGFFANEVSLRLGRREETRRSVAVLTPQQQRVLEGVASGLSNRQIAEALFVSSETVKSHLTNIYRQLDVDNRVEAVGKYFDLDVGPVLPAERGGAASHRGPGARD